MNAVVVTGPDGRMADAQVLRARGLEPCEGCDRWYPAAEIGDRYCLPCLIENRDQDDADVRELARRQLTAELSRLDVSEDEIELLLGVAEAAYS